MSALFLYTALALALVWIFLLLLSEETRKEQLIMSAVGLIITPGALLITSTDPRAGIQEYATAVGMPDLIFGTALFGIAAVLYQALFGKHAEKLRKKPYHLASPHMHWGAHLIIIVGVWLFIAAASHLVFLLPPLQSFIIAGLMIGIYLIAERKDLMTDALLSGIVIAILIFLLEQLFFVRLFPEAAAMYFEERGLSGIILGGIPAEEILWAAIVGFTVGPLYEYLRGLQLR